jgi:hypothetical protein
MFKKDTENYDVGRIDIFMRDTSNMDEFKFKKTSLNGIRSKSRFGFNIAKLGDINDDGFNGKINYSLNLIKTLKIYLHYLFCPIFSKILQSERLMMT